MKVDVSLGEILVIGSISCAIIIALGVSVGHVPILKGGAIIVSLCGGAAVAKVLKEVEQRSKKSGNQPETKMSG